MTTQVVCVYTIKNTGNITAAAIGTAITPTGTTGAYQPRPWIQPSLYLPWAWLWSLGALWISDTIANGPPTTRTVTLGLVPTSTATATATLVGNAVSTLTITGRGAGYTAPPVVSFTGGTSPFAGNSPPFGPPIGIGGSGSPDPALNSAARNANITAYIRVQSIAVGAAGTGYSATPVGTLVGGLSAGGVAGTVTIGTDGAGHVNAINLGTPGSGYIYPPVCVITDTTGTGAFGAVPVMELDSLTVNDMGFGYGAIPTVVLTPRFKYLFPDALGAAAQAKPFYRLMNILSQFAGPAVETAPAVT